MPTVILNEHEIAVLNEPIAGQGGFQTLLARFRDEVQPNGELGLSDADVGTIRRYRREYGGRGMAGASRQNLRPHTWTL